MSDVYSSDSVTRYFRLDTRDSTSQQTIMHVAWQDSTAVVFVIGDDGSEVLFVLDVPPKAGRDGLRSAVQNITDVVDIQDVLNRPNISDVRLGRYEPEAARIGQILGV